MKSLRPVPFYHSNVDDICNHGDDGSCDILALSSINHCSYNITSTAAAAAAAGGRFCCEYLPRDELTSSANEMLVIFQSNTSDVDATHRRGFQLAYSIG